MDPSLRATVKLLLVGHAIHPDRSLHEGVKGFATLLARTLAAAGHGCTVLSHDPGAKRAIRTFRDGAVRYHVVRWDPGRWDAEGWVLRWIAARDRPDAVLAFGRVPRRLPPGFRGRIALWIYRSNGIEALEPSPEVVLIGEHERLVAALGAAHPSQAIVEIPPCVDVDAFTPRDSSGGVERFRVFFGSSPLPKHEPAEVEERYLASRGVHTLLELVDALGPEGPVEVELLWRKDPTHIRSLTRDFPGVVRVHTEPIDDMNAHLERFDFCAAFYGDGDDTKAIPQNCLEALAKGIPLLTLCDTALGALIEKSGAGLVFEPQNWKAVGRRLGELREDPGEYVALARAARELACRHFAPDVVAGRVLEVLSP
jgi:glycosyltransferase involved in cell wall biosynthesis